MNRDWVPFLVCPASGRPLVLKDAVPADGDVVEEGLLVREDGAVAYPIRHGVPDFMRPVQDGRPEASTIEAFGREWEMFARWGWHEEAPAGSGLTHWGGLIANTRRAFAGKAPFQPGDLTSRTRILDAGCGNGRFSNVAAEICGSVVAVDASEAAFVAGRNLRGRPNVLVVRADILRLPFRDASFDAAFSIGVMQHTGAAPRLIASMMRVVRPGGPMTINCYGTGTATYELFDRAIRAVTTRLPIGGQRRFAAALARFDRLLLRCGRPGRLAHAGLNRYVMNLLPTDVHMLDWYAPRLAEHYSPAQLIRWVAEAGGEITHAVPDFLAAGYDDRGRRLAHAAMQFRFVSRRTAESVRAAG